MREVVVADTVQARIGELEGFLRDELRMSKTAARKRCDRMDEFFESLAGRVDYPLCRFKKWHRLGYRCAVFEKDWVFAYEVFDEGIIIQDMCHTAILKE
jgi:hypothetical protein